MKSFIAHGRCGAAIAVWLLLFSGSSTTAGDIRGRVTRPPAAAAQSSSAERYRSRDVVPRQEVGVDCICNPGLFSVIYLTGDSLPPITVPAEPPVVAQKDKMFVPAVLAVAAGTTVSFPNLDPFFHNVFSYSKPKKFDLGRYPKGETEEVTLDKPGIIKVFCEIHYSMRAYIHVLQTPYFTVSDDKGTFLLPSVKPGDYTLHVWQENQPELERAITVTSDSLSLKLE
jgi:plastocyanin